MEYLGHLQRRDPLYGFFRNEIQPKLDLYGERDYRVFRLHASNSVYLYEDTRTQRRLIGKFFYRGSGDRSAAHRRMTQEFANLEYMRSLGFGGNGSHYVARPLGQGAQLNELLLEEFCYGESLSSIIVRSIRNGDPGLLYGKLSALACFLCRFHNRTARPGRVDFRQFTDYAHGIIHTLFRRGWLDRCRRESFHGRVRAWYDRPGMWFDNPVIVHGDATPENFLFGDGPHVITFDLERMRCADRLFDAGRLCAELAHFFMLHTGDRFRSEPFIGNFLWEYSCYFPDRMAAFTAITRRLPFYMAVNLLRIARNAYFDEAYRQRLISAAEECLKGTGQ